MSVHDDAADVLHDVQDTVKAMFADEWVAGGILHDMVARFDPALTHGYSVVARGWRSLLQTTTVKNNADNSAFWVALYDQYQRVCACVPGCDSSIDGFVSLLQAGEDNSNWAAGDDDRIAAMCIDAVDVSDSDDDDDSDADAGLEEDSEDEAAPADVDTASAGDSVDTDSGDVAEDVTDSTDAVTDSTDSSDDVHDDAEGDTADVDDADDDDASVPAPAQEQPASPAQPASQRTKRPRRKRKKTKAASPKRKTRKASDKPMSTRTADDGATITPVDVDFRAREDYAEQIMPYVRSEVHADAAHVKSNVSGVHVYLAHRVYDMLDEGFRARGITHTLGLGSVISALIIAVLPPRETAELELSPMMDEAVAVLRDALDRSTSDSMTEMTDMLAVSVNVMRDIYAMQSKTHIESQVGSYIASLMLAERVGATSIPVGTKAEHMDVADVAADEFVARVRDHIVEAQAYAEERRKRSANFHAGDE